MARADFLRSIGVYVAQDRLYMVRMRRSLFRFALVQAESIPFEEKREASFRERHLVDAIQALLPMLGPKNTPVYLCFAPELAVECQVSLPEAARDDVERVLDYELERLIPFRRDEVYYDYVLAPGATGGKISVSLFAVPKALIDPVLDSLASGGYELLGAESVATSLFNYLLFLNRHEAGSDVVIGARDDALLVDGLRTSRGWSTSSEILYTHRMPNSSWSRGLGKEMLEGLIDESPRFYCWGDVGDIIEEDGPLASAKNLLEFGQERILMPAGVSEEFVPAIGACLRGLRESVLRVNFLPGSKHKSEAKSSFRLNGLLTALLLLSLMVWGASYAIKDEIRLRRMKSELAQIQPSVEELQAKEEELNRLTAQFTRLAELGANRGEVIRVLDELSRTIPTDAYLSNLRYREGSVELRGTAVNSSNLIPLLEGSGLFKEVGFNAPSTRRGRDNRESFSITANIERRSQPGGS